MYYIKVVKKDYFLTETYHSPDNIFFSLNSCKNGFRTPKKAKKYAEKLVKRLNNEVTTSVIYKEEE